MVAHGAAQGVRDAVHHAHVLLILLHDLLVAVDEVLAVAAACERAVVHILLLSNQTLII